MYELVFVNSSSSVVLLRESNGVSHCSGSLIKTQLSLSFLRGNYSDENRASAKSILPFDFEGNPGKYTCWAHI